MIGSRYIGHLLFVVSVFARVDSLALIKSSNFIIRTLTNTKIIKKKNSPIMFLRGGSTSTPTPTSTSNIDEIQRMTPEELQLDSLNLYNNLRNCQDEYMKKPLNKALDVLSDAIRLYGSEQIFASYNGGKDAVVVLHLLRAVTAKKIDEKKIKNKPEFIYFYVQDEFLEILEHINYTEKKYGLDLRRYESGIGAGLSEHIKYVNDRGFVTPAFILGTRKGDANRCMYRCKHMCFCVNKYLYMGVYG